MTAMLLLHVGEPLQPHDLWQSWSFEPGMVFSLAIPALLFALGVWRSRSDANHRVVLFFAGWLALALAMLSPLHRLGGALFSAHMVQHEVLMLVAAPLLVWSQPALVFLRALPMPWRLEAGGAFRLAMVRKVWAVLTTPLMAWSIHAAALWVWHVPALFQKTLENEWIHALQHASFFFSALLFWWALLHGSKYGIAVLSVFTTAVHTSVLGALLTFARVAWYPAYAESAPAWGLTGLEDQQLAGLIMWVPASIVFIAIGLFLMQAWLKQSDARLALHRRLTPRRPVSF
jgi:cytochrome c oxidase assembly factor CtaG